MYILVIVYYTLAQWDSKIMRICDDKGEYENTRVQDDENMQIDNENNR